MHRFIIVPDVKYKKASVCLMSFGSVDCIFRVSKEPIFFEAEPRLISILKGKEVFIKTELERTQDIDSFCQKIFTLVSKLINTKETKISKVNSKYFRRVLDEIRNVGWEKISAVDPTLSTFDVTINDKKDRKITLTFSLSSTFPHTPPTVTSNLPVSPKFAWEVNKTTLKDIVDLYELALPSFDGMWTQLEDLDKNACVIDPKHPSLSCCSRLLYLSPQLWVHIELKPLHTSLRPLIKFRGSDQARREAQQKLDEGSSRWDRTKSVRENLEAVLGAKLPGNTENEEAEIECQICFCERIGGELPEVVCENPRCAKHFHRSCLVDWLRENRKVEQSFHSVYGNCPNCGAKIQCDER